LLKPLDFGRLKDDEHLPLEVLEHSPEDSYGEAITRRCGKPWNTTYMQVRTQLFLTNMLQIGTHSGPNPSALYVQRDFISAFFDLTEFEHSPSELITLGFQASQTPVPDSRNFEGVEERNLQEGTPQSILPTPDEISSAAESNLGESEDAAAQLEDNPFDIMANLPPGSLNIQNRRRVPPHSQETFGNAQLSSSAALTVHSAVGRPRSVIPQISFVLGEHNGMFYRRVEINANQIERYLEQRHCWTGMILHDGVLQTMRHEHILKHMIHDANEQKSFIMVKNTYIR
jgi:hypothetical protein